MTMKQIPDVNYKLSDDGDLLTIEQGQVEPVIIQLHKIHVKHFAELMNISIEDDEDSPMLIDYLERINEQAEDLYRFLEAVPCYSTNTNISEDVAMAKKLYEIANRALGFWGAN